MYLLESYIYYKLRYYIVSDMGSKEVYFKFICLFISYLVYGKEQIKINGESRERIGRKYGKHKTYQK